MKINTILTHLENEKDADSAKQSAISEISDRAQAILVAVNKAENEIDSQSNEYVRKESHKPGYGENDEDHEDEYEEDGDFEPGVHKTE